MGFNTTWTNSNFGDLQKISELNQYVDALNERIAFMGAVVFNPQWAVGDNLQDHAKIAAMQSGAFGLGNANPTTWTPAGSFAGVAWVNGGTYSARPWDWVDATYIRAHALGGNTDYTRKYPREHANAASTVYTDGSAFANGHVSRRVSDQQVYNRTSGAWVLASAGTYPDVVTAFGLCAAGDFLGPWLFNEIRDVLKLYGGISLATAWLTDTGDDWSSGNSLAYGSALAARAAALANFAATANFGAVGDPSAQAYQRDIPGFGFTAKLDARRTYQGFTLSSGNPFIGMSYEVYVPGVLVTSAGAGGIYESPPGYTQNVWSLATTTTLALGANKAYAGSTAAPGWAGDPSYPTLPETAKGYGVSGRAAGVVRPAFTYT